MKAILRTIIQPFITRNLNTDNIFNYILNYNHYMLFINIDLINFGTQNSKPHG